MTELLDEKIAEELAKIEEMDSVSVEIYKNNRIMYSPHGRLRDTLIRACEAKMERYNRDGAMVETSDPEDMGGE